MSQTVYCRGDFDPENLKDNQIIVSVLRMDQRAGGGLPGPYKEGSPMMDYHAGTRFKSNTGMIFGRIRKSMRPFRIQMQNILIKLTR